MPIYKDKKHFSKQITARFILAMDEIRDNTGHGKITAAAFGKIVGISPSNLNRLRVSKGENTITLEAIARMCNHFGVSEYWVMTGKGDMKGNITYMATTNFLENRIADIEDAMGAMQMALKSLKGRNIRKKDEQEVGRGLISTFQEKG